MTPEKDMDWLGVLDSVIESIKSSWHEINFDAWDSLIVNRRKPHTYRAWTMFKTVQPGAFINEGPYSGDVRVCLHRFESCSPQEAFPHPHPWPGAFALLEGSYVMRVGLSPDYEADSDHVLTTVLGPGSRYAITNPLAWHSVQPLGTCYSIMVNGVPWEKQHRAAPTTKGKDLDSMSIGDLSDHLQKFKGLLGI